MFIKRSSPKIEEVEIVDNLKKFDKMAKCAVCGKPFLQKCTELGCEIVCSECKNKTATEC